MAIIVANDLIEGASGKIGKLVLKQFKGKTVISKAPDRSKVKLSDTQKAANGRFKEAVAFAKDILRNEEKRKAYEATLKPGKSVYHTALAEYLGKK
jgi:short-subunit dehydrogenase